jgi:SagB-type dehydrogenase family enzyme
MLRKASATTFPSPSQEGSAALEYCIRQRRSVRGFRDRTLTKGEVGQLLWAAQGITGDDGERAAASAGALYPLELYVAIGNATSLSPGVYHYVPGQHELHSIVLGHQREKLVEAARGQEWIATAPAVICIAANFERTTAKYGLRGGRYVYIEVGLAAESLMLQAVALGLATTLVGAFDDDEVGRVLHLRANEVPVCLIAVGAPEDQPEDRSASQNWEI